MFCSHSSENISNFLLLFFFLLQRRGIYYEIKFIFKILLKNKVAFKKKSELGFKLKVKKKAIKKLESFFQA